MNEEEQSMFKISKPLHLSAMSLVSIMLIPIVCSCQSDIMSSKDVTEGAPKSAVAPYYYLPKADVTIAITDAAIGDKATTFQIAIKSTRYLPDPKHMYRIDVDENAFSDDEVDVQTSTDGLLTSVKGKSKDQTGAVLAKLAELAKEAAKFTAFAGAELFSAELGSGLIAWPSKGRRRGKWRRGSCGRACRSEWRGAASP